MSDIRHIQNMVRLSVLDATNVANRILQDRLRADKWAPEAASAIRVKWDGVSGFKADYAESASDSVVKEEYGGLKTPPKATLRWFDQNVDRLVEQHLERSLSQRLGR